MDLNGIMEFARSSKNMSVGDEWMNVGNGEMEDFSLGQIQRL